MYKAKIKEWGLDKNLNATAKRILIAKRDKRAQSRGVRTRFIVGGVELSDERLERFTKKDIEEEGNKPSPSARKYMSPQNYNPYAKSSYAATPAGVEIITPMSSITDPRSLNDPTDEGFRSQIMQHFQTIQPVMTAKVENEIPINDHQTIRRVKSEDVRHIHRMGDQGIACRGRCVDKMKAADYLWQARNLAVSISEMLHRSVVAGRPKKWNAFSSEPLVPQFWIPPQAFATIEVSRLQTVLQKVKQSGLCTELLDLTGKDRFNWKKNWALMTHDDGSRTEALSRDLFGDPSLPYPEMNLFTIFIRFDTAHSSMRPVLLRLVFGIDPREYIQHCSLCHNDFMILDLIDSGAAVKIHIPMNSARDYFYQNWQDYSDRLRMKICDEEATWRDMDYLYQGWFCVLVLILPTGDQEHTSEDTEWDEFAPEGIVTEFQPFATAMHWHLFLREHSNEMPEKELYREWGEGWLDDDKPFDAFPD